MCFKFINRSISKLLAGETLVFSWIDVAVMAASVVVKEALARWALGLARRHGAEAVEADAWHHRSDVIASLLVLVGVVVGEKVWWIDGVLGIVVSGLIIYVAYDIIQEGLPGHNG